jgi:hypothetical protein
MIMDIKEQYMKKFEEFLKSLPSDAITIRNSLDEEITKRVDEYKNGSARSVPFNQNLSSVREKLVAQI